MTVVSVRWLHRHCRVFRRLLCHIELVEIATATSTDRELITIYVDVRESVEAERVKMGE